jgi:carboxyl-terminal processing protease
MFRTTEKTTEKRCRPEPGGSASFVEDFMFFNRCMGIALLLVGLMITPGPGRADSDPYLPLKRFSQILDLVERNYVEDVTREDLINGAIQGLLQELDPHSSYLAKEDFAEMQMDTSGEFSGIGIVISMENGRLTVVSPIEDTPAYDADVRAEDIILEIDGSPAAEMTLNDAVKKIRGPIGSEVKLTILHKGEDAPVRVSIKRAKIPLHSVKDVELEPGYVYLRLTRFRENTTDELKRATEKYKKNLKGIILDLRNNPGGLLDQAVSVTDLFLEKGKIVFTKGRVPNAQMEFVAKKETTDINVPVIILINAGSASASEIVAGALKDHNRAILLGEKTFGKGSVQSVIPLADGSGIKLTTARYYTPNGISIQAQGIDPDIFMPFVPQPKKDEKQEENKVIRENDLTKHLEGVIDGPGDTGALDPKAKEILERDNQIRMALELVKNLPRFQEIR